MTRTILLINDDRDEIESIRHLIRKHFDELIVTSLINEGVDLFKRHKPGVLLISYSNIEMTEHTYLNFFQTADSQASHAHETIALCKKNDTRKAYQLCRRGIFQDYIVDRPLYDPFRLSQAIFSAFIRLEQRLQLEAAFMQSTRLREWLHRIEKMFDDSEEAGYLLTHNQISHYAKTIRNFDNDLVRLQHDLNNAFSISRKAANQAEAGASSTPPATQKEDAKVRKGEKQSSGTLDTRFLFKKKYQPFQTNARGTLLVVEDDKIQHKVLRHLLAPTNLRIEFAENGLEVFEILRSGIVDIILMDIGLPGIDGINMTRLIKLTPEYKHIPIITLTSHSEKQVVEDSINAGAVDYIVKPVNLTHLLEKINAHLPAVKRIALKTFIPESI